MGKRNTEAMAKKYADELGGAFCRLIAEALQAAGCAAEPDEPERPFKVGDTVESITNRQWAGPMTVERVWACEKVATCKHPIKGNVNFPWSDLRPYVPLKPGDEVEIEGINWCGLKVTVTSARAEEVFINLRGADHGARTYGICVRADLVRRKS